MSRFKFVDIGTSDFDYSKIPGDGDERSLLVEPLQIYLDRCISNKNIIKANYAISDSNRIGKISYVHPDNIEKYKMEPWMRGCNSLDSKHNTVVEYIRAQGLPSDLIEEAEVKVITFLDLVNMFSIDYIEYLKIDTEGHDHVILKQVLELIEEIYIKSIRFEYTNWFGNKHMLDGLIRQFNSRGFKSLEMSNDFLLTNENADVAQG